MFNLLELVKGQEGYTNFIVSEVNDHAVRIALINGEFHWHNPVSANTMHRTRSFERTVKICFEITHIDIKGSK